MLLCSFPEDSRLTFDKVNVNIDKNNPNSKPRADRGPRRKPLLCPHLYNDRKRPAPINEEAENGSTIERDLRAVTSILTSPHTIRPCDSDSTRYYGYWLSAYPICKHPGKSRAIRICTETAIGPGTGVNRGRPWNSQQGLSRSVLFEGGRRPRPRKGVCRDLVPDSRWDRFIRTG